MSSVTTSQSWFSRIGGAIKGVFFGILFIVIAVGVLFWNEGRAVKREKALSEGQENVVMASATTVDPSNEGKLIYISGGVSTDDTLTDEIFAVTYQGIKLKRTVEMYQWEEKKDSSTETRTGGSTETTTTYSYKKIWSESLIDSSRFHDSGYNNPSQMPYRTNTFQANNVTLGGYELSYSLIADINNYQSYPVSELNESVKASLPSNTKVVGTGYYIGEDSDNPALGDMRVSFEVVEPGVVSIVSQQSGNSFIPYLAENGGKVELLEIGTKSADEMFESAQTTNKIVTWVVRVIGFLFIFFGFNMLLTPLEVLADVIPFIGNIVGAGNGIISFLLALPLAFTTIAIAWIVYRPILGISLLVIGAGLIGVAIWKISKAGKRVEAQSTI